MNRPAFGKYLPRALRHRGRDGRRGGEQRADQGPGRVDWPSRYVDVGEGASPAQARGHQSLLQASGLGLDTYARLSKIDFFTVFCTNLLVATPA